MTWKDKLELGLKDDAAYRKDNLPESQVRGPEIPSGPGRSPEIPAARHDTNVLPNAHDHGQLKAENEFDPDQRAEEDDGATEPTDTGHGDSPMPHSEQRPR